MKAKIILLLLLLSLFVSDRALALQLMAVDSTGKGYFLPTTPSMPLIYPERYSGNLTRLKPEGKFQADDISNYPREIYLPNETNPAGYRIHSNYTANTNACKSCHATHTAVGPALLQWFNTYYTCMACHDGTVSTTYNVKEGLIADTGQPTFGGAFGTGKELSLSNHNVRETINIFAAPGGATKEWAETHPNPDPEGANTSWVVDFGCESCHSPHGQGGNARILNPNPNGVSWKKYNDPDPARDTKDVPLVWSAVDQGYKIAGGYFALLGYPYDQLIQVKDDGVAVDAPYLVDNTNGEYTVIKFSGYQPAGALTIDFVPALKVSLKISNYLQGNEEVEHLRGMNAFCGACHPDYNTAGDLGQDQPGSQASGSSPSGRFSEAYRHQVGIDPAGSYLQEGNPRLGQYGMKLEEGKMTCQTCHFAHGTNRDYWKRTIGSGSFLAENLRFTDSQITEVAGSSALKRLPNMGTCEVCHEKGEGQEGSWAASGLPGPVASLAGTSNGLFTQETAQYQDDQDYRCETCHAKQYRDFMANRHSQTGMVFCSNCHWPTGNHLKNPSSTNIKVPSTVEIQDFLSKPDWYTSSPSDPGWNTLCWFCHESWYGNEAGEFKESSHYQSRLLNCFTCHYPMHDRFRIKPEQACAICHEEKFDIPALMAQYGHAFGPPVTAKTQESISTYLHAPSKTNCLECHEMRSNRMKEPTSP